MVNISENLEVLEGVKDDIKTAIENKGIVINDTTPFVDYATKINEISIGTGDYQDGYEQGKLDQKALLENRTFRRNGTYSRPDGYGTVVVDVPNTGLTTIDVAEYGIKFANSPLTEIPEIFDFSNVTDYSYMFTNCKNLTGSPISNSIVVDGSGEYAFYDSNIKIPNNIHINNNASTFNMIGGSFANGYSKITTNGYELNIVCDNFPFNIISNTQYNDFLYITLGKSYVPGRDGDWDEKHQLFNNFICYYIAIKAQPDQELEWLLRGVSAEAIILGDNSSSFNYSRGTSDGNVVFEVSNCRSFYLLGDYSNYGCRTVNGERYYNDYFFDCEEVGGCKNLKGTFKFTNANTGIFTIRNFINNIGSVPVEDECRILLPTILENLLTDEEIAIAVNKGYSVYF